jgi:hypothetical protein
MALPGNAQDLIRSLDTGRAGRLVALAAGLCVLLLLSLLLAWKQFHGPATEDTLLQADLGRQLARGEGFTTQVNLPQSAAFLQSRGVRFDPARPYPELHHAPLYPLAIAGGLRLFPSSVREGWLSSIQPPPDGYGGDYYLLALNLLLLWLCAFLAWWLGRRLFSPMAGLVAGLALLLSVGAWEHVLAVDGALLVAALVLGAFHCVHSVETDLGVGRAPGLLPVAGLGLLSGLLFLADYKAGFAGLVFLGWLALRRGLGLRSAAFWIALGACLAPCLPWLLRNLMLTGSPVGLAWQSLALRVGDTTADPGTWLTSLSAGELPLSANKLGNKLLTSLQEALRGGLWTAGAPLLIAFFIAGCLYQFRDVVVNRCRWLLLAVLGLWLLGHALCGSGLSGAAPEFCLSPLLMILGAGFFEVLLGSSAAVAARPRLAAALLLAVGSLPLLHEALEPRRIHFHYPPYFPSLFQGVHQELVQRSPGRLHGLMSDVPAGVAWYGDQRVWAQPAKLRDFYLICAEQPIGVLILTPHTLDRPFFTELAAKPALPQSLLPGDLRRGEWGTVYASFLSGRLPAEFPLRSVQKLADNLVILSDPSLPPRR